MIIEYRIRIDEEYVETGLARYRSLDRSGRWFTGVKWLCGLVLGGIVVLLAVHGGFGPAAGLSGVLVLLAVSGRIDGWLRRSNLRKWIRIGEEVTVVLSDEGVHARDSLTELRAAWPFIRFAIRAADGWLLIDDTAKPRWLPDAATRSTPSEIEALLRTVLAERVVV
ncbi:MAG TPA: hypothetical protein VN851_17300 [Thermoanaerobaculia bacterium]|nr:hypothetical protein [Thermoanaerobaculia bacterium]